MTWDVRSTPLEDPDVCVHCGTSPCTHPPTGPWRAVYDVGVGYAVVVVAALVFWLVVIGGGMWLAGR
jgi:hypothetical protein